MQDRPKNKRLSLGAVAGITAAVLALGGGSAWLAYRSVIASKTQPQPITSQATQPTQPTVEQEARAQTYWLSDTGERIKLVPTSVEQQKSASDRDVLETAFKTLLTGPKNAAETTAIPNGTKLLGLTTNKDGVHLNLSEEFIAGGGSTSMTGRLAQIIYTATSVDPQAQVWIDVNGKPLELLGEGEGLVVDQPMTRESFEENFEL
jgi:spore germination protein GerM